MALSPRRLAVWHHDSQAARRFAMVHRTLQSLVMAALHDPGDSSDRAAARLLARLWAAAKSDPQAATSDTQSFLDWAAVTLVRLVRETYPAPDSPTPQMQRLFAPVKLTSAAELESAILRFEVVVAELAVTQQLVAVLHYLEGRDVEGIGAALHMEEHDVMHHLQVAHPFLRSRLSEERES